MLKDLLIKKRSSILNLWTKLIFDSYPPETSGFLKLEKNRFNNPVGQTIEQNVGLIFDEIVNSSDHERLNFLLNDIIKIRAVQSFSPSQAISFIFLLKSAIKDLLWNEVKEKQNVDEFLALQSNIDRAALNAFDLYMEDKEKIFQIRINEIRSKSSTLFEKIENDKIERKNQFLL